MQTKYTTCEPLTCVVIGAGPVGLRTAIGMALLGARVHLIEKRKDVNRPAALKLSDWLCKDLLKLGISVEEIRGTVSSTHTRFVSSLR